jgi:hypothetical protein
LGWQSFTALGQSLTRFDAIEAHYEKPREHQSKPGYYWIDRLTQLCDNSKCERTLRYFQFRKGAARRIAGPSLFFGWRKAAKSQHFCAVKVNRRCYFPAKTAKTAGMAVHSDGPLPNDASSWAIVSLEPYVGWGEPKFGTAKPGALVSRAIPDRHDPTY